MPRLEDAAVRLAESHTVSSHPRRRGSLLERIGGQNDLLRQAYRYFARASEAQRPVSYAGEWLLDNFYVVQQALRQIREDMPASYYRRLPKLGTSALEGYPRIYGVARELVQLCESHLDANRVEGFIQVYQGVTPLTIGELWALPSMLRIGISERLSQAIAQVTGLKAPAEDKALEADDLEAEAVVANCIISLRFLATQDWKRFFESVSRVEKVLRSDPAGVYARMDFETRDRYRNLVEELALSAGLEEERVAREAIWLARTAMEEGNGDSRTLHVGFYLLDAGRPQLEARLGYRPSRSAQVRRWLYRHAATAYLGAMVSLSAVLVLGAVWYAADRGGGLIQLIGAAVLSAVPASAAAVSLVNWLVTHTVPPRALPRLDFRKGVPAESRTLVVVPALVTGLGEVDALLGQLELHHLCNTDAHIHFALLADLADAPQKEMPGDAELIEGLKNGIQGLNSKYGRTRFFLFFREREWNPAESCWMGWERKRGKLIELNRLLRGRESSYSERIGALALLPEVRYVITLDADTSLPRDSAHRLIGTLAHPLNQAQFGPDGAVSSGYTVLQPRVEVKPESANRSPFTRIFAGDTTLDLYTRAVSDVYQDLLGEGSYVGKGIYEVSAFERSLAGRVPDNALLSHDLFEGLHGRAGLVTDVVLYEDYPPYYLAYARRLHRWVRGDWQLLPWLAPRVPHAGEGTIRNRLSAFDRWRIADNLRRSTLAPALLLLLFAGWWWLPGSPTLWTLAALLVSAMPLVTGILTASAGRLRQATPRAAGSSARLATYRWLLELAFLPYETLLMTDAIASTLVRLLITRKRLLQWTTAAHTIRVFGQERKLAVNWRRMTAALLLASELALLMGLIRPATLPLVVPFLLAWLASPLIVGWIGRPTVHEERPLSPEERQRLRHLSRRTWFFFERFVGPDDHWLPPDHFQEEPRGLVAHRTSPTNIGLLLLSTLAAYDLGYIGVMELALRLRSTLDGMSGLVRHQGHLLNWYDTRTLEPLPPRYVSTVDSGNLAGCLMALRQGCRTLPHEPVMRWRSWQGLLDTLGVLSETLRALEGERLVAAGVVLDTYLDQVRQRVLAVKERPAQWVPLLVQLGEESSEELGRLLVRLLESSPDALDVKTLHSLRLWLERVRYHLSKAREDLDLLLPWSVLLTRPPALFMAGVPDSPVSGTWEALRELLSVIPGLGQIPALCRKARAKLSALEDCLVDGAGSPDELAEARAWCAGVAEGLVSARLTAGGVLIGFQNVCDQVQAEYEGMGFGFLLDGQRQVFHLGYHVDTGRLDSNHYDLLASEARLASLLAVSNGDVPQSHWLHLARPITEIDGVRALLSWNGSMFEYLMPLLLVRRYPGTLLDGTHRAVVQRQIDYGRQKGVPWGISEAGYFGFDAQMNYQYRGFGVPGLGFKRGLSDDLVISPYASLLALSIRPRAVMQNLAHLTQLEMLGTYGFYEAMDYTRSRLSLGQESGMVRSFMAHHQGMILVSLVNYLEDEAMIGRFHSDPQAQSVELLLQERLPRQVPVEVPHPEEVGALAPVKPRPAPSPWKVPVEGALPQVHYLSNGRYGLLITSAGGGYSEWNGRALTRWRADTTLDDWGTWLYVQDRDTGALWSAGLQPTGRAPESHEVRFYAHRAQFQRRDHDISLHLEIVVAPNDDVEIRLVTLMNHSDRSRRLTLTSYGEVVLAPQAADRRHPAFNRLFVESEYLPEVNGLLFRRRRRSADEEPIYLVHQLVLGWGERLTGGHETDRARFLGRNGTPRLPGALAPDGEGLSGTTGATLDPIMALGQRIELEPRAEVQVAFLTLAAGSRAEALRLAGRYQAPHMIDRALGEARSSAELELHQLDLTVPQVQRIQELLSALLYPHPALRADPSALVQNRLGQPALWRYAISGDYPILLARIGSQEEAALVAELLQAHAYWRNRHIRIDLVILNLQDTSYSQELQNRLQGLLIRSGSDAWVNRRGGIFMLRAEGMSEGERILLETVARVVLGGERGTLAQQLGRLQGRPPRLPSFVSTAYPPTEEESTPPLSRPTDLLYDNGLGGFSADGREYLIYLEAGRATPAPWINVIANPEFGFLTSEAGLGYTWAVNSGENRLTPWHNDPVRDLPAEAVYLRDEEVGHVWSPTPLPMGPPAPFLVRHGAGYSVFEHNSHGLKQRMCVFAVPEAPVKVVQLRLENTWGRNRRITVTYYAEWVLGTARDVHQGYVVPEFDAVQNALLARNPYHTEFGERVAFLASSREPHGLTTDRTEFLGRTGSLRDPAALRRVGLSGTVRAGLDPCAAMQVHVWMAPHEVEELFFLVGQGADRAEALGLVRHYRDPEEVAAAWEEMQVSWEARLGTVTVETPDRAMDLLLNRWLLYQALSCRVWGRSALYQSSGAYGYRDQLQDVMGLTLAAPELARSHILEAARHQFEAGDVLHWWHPPSGRGVRTLCSDDLLWLPFVTAHYIRTTGDESILSERVPFLRGDPLGEDEHERYGLYEPAAEGHTLFEHCRRALEKGSTAGSHGLPLIGSHDWNDGFSRVGIEGKGESIWLGWFLLVTKSHFAELCDRVGEHELAEGYREAADELREGIESGGWDGAWYRRAYYDDGTPLGSAENDECQIDSLAQSWAVLSGAARPERAARAMEAVDERLVRPDDRLIALFTPPFDRTAHDPGYIKGYLPGIRENGGQYTHAALWVVWAFAELGDGDRAEALFRLLNPVYHSDTPAKVARYRVEPYVVAADVYSVPPHTGRGGWTWYTGSAGWMLRLGLEAILGVRRVGESLKVEPCIPKSWPGYRVVYCYGDARYEVRVENPEGVNRGVKRVTLDGEVLPGGLIPLTQDGREHHVQVLMG